MKRFKIKTGKFGSYFFDQKEGKDLTLVEVEKRLNKSTTIEISEDFFDEIMCKRFDEGGYIPRIHPSSHAYKEIKRNLGF